MNPILAAPAGAEKTALRRKLSATIVSFGLNERMNLEETFPEVDRRWAERFVYVDGPSTDGSAEAARRLGWEVYRQQGPGLRNAYKEIFSRVETDLVLVFSPDGNTPAEAIPRLLEKMEEGHDMVIASRYLKGGFSDDDDLASGWANRIFRVYINLLFRGRLTDPMTNYRAYRTKLFFELGLDQAPIYAPFERFFLLPPGGLGIEPLLSARALHSRCRIAEIYAEEPARIHGKGKFPKVRGGLGYFFQLMRERLSPHRREAPAP